MIDMRPVGYVIGLLTAAMGLTMVAPMLFDIFHNDPEWKTFLQSSVLTTMAGVFLALACSNQLADGLTLKQSFILTTGVWIALPAFGAIPFMIGETELSLVDAVFESMSGMTTTGATAIEGLETHSYGILLWRGILQWLGGLGIIIVAMIFLPVMKVGGMQFFQSEGFDTSGKSLPRALDIAKGLLNIYIGLTVLCALCYGIAGMNMQESIVHAFTTIATGGYSTSDASFAAFPGAPQYVSVVFMFLASVPFLRFLQVLSGDPKPLFKDAQVRAYFTWTLYATALIVVFRMFSHGDYSEEMFRSTLFNVVSIFSGTGYGDGDVLAWGPFAFAILFAVGMIGGCSGSTGCSIKVFRYQFMLRAISAQIQRLYSPSRVVAVRFEGRAVSDDVLSSVMLLFSCFVMTFGILVVLMGMTGLSFFAAITGAWTSIFNIGPVFGPEVGPSGAVHPFPDTAKWLMILGMLLGRLEIVSVVVLILPRFWRS
jgi:trk system potassium uptake protein TrkH